TLEPLPAFGVVCQQRRQHLERHRAVQLRVLGRVDFAHAPLAEGPADPVVVQGLWNGHAGLLSTVRRPLPRASRPTLPDVRHSRPQPADRARYDPTLMRNTLRSLAASPG